MAIITTKGTCKLCGALLGKRAMQNHLPKCIAANANTEIEVFDLLVQAAGAPYFWLYIEAQTTAKLADLDLFLRHIWLECCGHMSVFRIGRTNYFVPGAGLGGKSMKNTLESVLRPGDEFEHEYDFGDTTYLELTVLARRRGAVPSEKVRLLARNEAPPLNCRRCKKPAIIICTQCFDGEPPVFCDACIADHEHDEDYYLPVVNSPRCGMCGYTGE